MTPASSCSNSLQQIFVSLEQYWQRQGCLIIQPYDMEVGAGTFHPETFLRAIGPEPWYAAHVQASRRPTDGRYGTHPNRGQHFYQYQVIMKPVPLNFQELYLGSLVSLGIDPLLHDIRFVEDNWESPTLGAWGLGWEVWLDGMEITQFTYFQQVGGINCAPVTGELAYGVERLALYLQGVDNIKDVIWGENLNGPIKYGILTEQREFEMSKFQFEIADTKLLFQQFAEYESEAKRLLEAELAIPAYEMVLKISHIFNILDARSAVSVTERQLYILRVRALAIKVAQAYYTVREQLGFPLSMSNSEGVTCQQK